MKKRGFTLIELIVVLAILAIVAAIAVPTAFSSIEKARTAACAANIESVYGQWRVDMATNMIATEALATDRQKELLQGALAELQPACPSNGTYNIKEKDGILSVVCTKHGEISEEEVRAALATNLYKAFADAVATGVPGYTFQNNFAYDSTAATGKGAVAIKEALNANGVEWDENTVWQISSATQGDAGGNRYVYFATDYTTEEFNQLPAGTTVNVVRYDANGNAATGTVQVYKQDGVIKMGTINQGITKNNFKEN